MVVDGVDDAWDKFSVCRLRSLAGLARAMPARAEARRRHLGDRLYHNIFRLGVALQDQF
jgi:hypothetical protein